MERQQPGEVEGKATRVESGQSRTGEIAKGGIPLEASRGHESQGARTVQAPKAREGGLGKPPSRGRGGTAGSAGGPFSRGGRGVYFNDNVICTCPCYNNNNKKVLLLSNVTHGVLVPQREGVTFGHGAVMEGGIGVKPATG